MRRLLTALLLAVVVTAGAVPAGAAPTNEGGHTAELSAEATNTTNATAGATTVTLLTYNDVQTAAAKTGTFPRLVEVVHRRRVAHDNPTVVVGGGDQVSPHALSPVSQWRAPVAVLNHMSPAADVVGNHDLDYGLDAVENYSAASEFPWLAANLVDESDGEIIDGTKPYHVVERGGVRIGFVGLVDDAIKGKTAVNFSEQGVRVADYREVGTETATMLKEEKNVDVVVALAHVGVPDAKELANASENIDAIVVGDDEIYYPPQETSGTVIVEGVARAEYVGEVNMTVEGGEVTAWNGRLVNVTSETPTNETAADLIQGYHDNVSLDSTVGRTTVALDATFATNYHEESRYGNLVTDAMRAKTGADVAVTNAGGIRSNSVYGPGNITGGDVFNTLPFANTLVTVRLSGAELERVLESQVVTLSSETGRKFGEEISQQVSGVRFEWVPHGEAQVREIYVNGEPLREDATYTVTVNSYMAGGGSGYPLADAPRVATTDTLLAEAVIDYFEAEGTVSPGVEGRMRRVDTDLSDGGVYLDGEGRVVLSYDAPANATRAVDGTFYATDGDHRVAPEKVFLHDGRLVVQFDDAALAAAFESGDAIEVYGGYEGGIEDRLVYFDHARVNADLTVYDGTERGSENGNGEREAGAE